MKALAVTLDINQVPAYGLKLSGKNIFFNIDNDTTEKTIAVPVGASYMVYGSTGDLAISPVTFALPALGQIIVDSPAQLNPPPLIELDGETALFFRTPVPGGLFVTVSFYQRHV